MALGTQYQLDEVPKRWPLVQTPENREATFTKDAQLVNCYAEKQIADGSYWIIKRPGLSSAVYTRSGTGRGGFLWSALSGGGVFFIFSGTVYKNNNSIGSIVNAARKEHFQLMDRAVTPKLVFGDGVDGYFTDGTTVTHIVDADFPTAFVPGLVYLDGTLYVMDYNCNIKGSAIEDPATWDPLNTIQARNQPGSGVALLKHLTYVVALKESSTEAFYNAGNPTGSPLSRLDGGFTNFGCFLGESVQTSYDTAIWVTSSNTNSPQIVRMDNLNIKIISTPAVERLLNSFDLTSVVESWTFNHAGHRFYAVTSVGSNITIVYDIDQNLWYRWTTSTGANLDIVDIFNDNTVTPNRHLAQGRLDGNVYAIDTCFIYPTDAGTVFPVDIITPNFDGGVARRKHLSQIFFDADRVVGSVLQVRRNDFDYDPKRWSNWREVNLGNTRPYLNKEGTFNKRAYQFRHAKPLPFRLKAADLQLSLGTL